MEGGRLLASPFVPRRFPYSFSPSATGLLQGFSELLYVGETLVWFFRQRLEHNPLNRWRDLGKLFPQWPRGIVQVLHRHLYGGAIKRRLPAEPFVDNDAKCVLVAGRASLFAQLLRRHVGDGPDGVLCAQRMGIVGHNSDAEIAEQNLVLAANQQIIRFDIAVNQIFFMRILETDTGRRVPAG